MRWLERIVVGLAALRGAARARPLRDEDRRDGADERIVPAGEPDRRAETVVIVLFLLAALCAAGFVVVYSFQSLGNTTQLLGITFGAALALVATALIIIGKRLVVTEELEEEYPPPGRVEDQNAIDRVVAESGSRFTRKKLVLGAGATAGGAMALAAITPALSLGPWLDTSSLANTPWSRGRRLVDREGRPLEAGHIEQSTFYTAYADGAPRDDIGSPLVVVRLDPSALRLPPERAQWAPEGILAYSKICTHASCAIALYRTPLDPATAPGPALVCPCHYSTFDPATGGTVIFGPAGRDLPQLPLMVDARGLLRAAGNFSGPVGASWSGVRSKRPT